MAKSPIYGLKTAVEAAQSTADSKNTVVEEIAFYTKCLGRGSTDTAIPYFQDAQYDSSGVLGTITNDSTNGFKFTALEDCTVVATLSMNSNAAGQ